MEKNFSPRSTVNLKFYFKLDQISFGQPSNMHNRSTYEISPDDKCTTKDYTQKKLDQLDLHRKN